MIAYFRRCTKMSEQLLELVNTAARWIGYSFLAMAALIFLGVLKRQITSEIEVGGQGPPDVDTETTVNDIIEEDLPNPERFTELDYEPSAACSWDWSMGRSIDKHELLEIKSELESAGFFVHPFPRDPHSGFIDRDWRWGQKNMGLWTEKPQFYAKTDDGEEVEVTPDLGSWEVETTSEMPTTSEDYGYMDSWERENIHDMGSGGESA